MFPSKYFPASYFNPIYFPMMLQMPNPNISLVIDEIRRLIPRYQLRESLPSFNLDIIKSLLSVTALYDFTSKPITEPENE